MSRTYTRLPLALGAWQSNFVALPNDFARAIRSAPEYANQGVVALRLNWTGLKAGSQSETETKECFVGWNGAISRGTYLQVPDRLGELSGLSLALVESKARGGSGLIVNVYAVKNCEIAKRVDVEPESFEDWEALERHAGFVETQMLSQICVLYPQQHFVVWVANVPVKLKVISGVNPPCIKMANETEVVVAPKPRPDAPRAIASNANDSEEAEEDANAAAAVVLRVQPLEDVDDQGYSKNGIVFVSGSTLALMREVAHWDASGEDSLDSQTNIGQAVSSLNPAHPVLCRVLLLDANEDRDLSIQYSIVISERIAHGHVGMSMSARRGLIKPFTRVRLIPAHFSNDYKSKNIPNAVQLRRLTNPGWIQHSSLILSDNNEYDLRQAIKRSLSLNASVLSNGTWVYMDKSYYKLICPSIKNGFILKDDPAVDSIAWSIGDDLPIVLGTRSSMSSNTTANNNNHSSSEEKSSNEETEDDEFEFIDRVWETNDDWMSCWTLETLGGPSRKAGEELKRHFIPLLSTEASLARAQLGTAFINGAYLYGPRGCGKSTLIKAIGKSLGLEKDFLTCTVRVECAALKGGKRSVVQKKLERAIQLAQSRSPSLVVLEDLDALLPQPANPGEEDAQTVWLSEFLEGMVHECRARQERFEQTAIEAVLNGQLSSYSDVPQWNKFAVGFVATGRGRKTMRTALTRLGMFEKRIEMPVLDLQGRRDVLQAICTSIKDALDTPTENELDVVAARTEGYSAADLETLVERAVHAKAAEEMDLQLKENKKNALATTIDNKGYLEQALEGFTPASLRGVKLAKSETSWSDVGGLDLVRNVLKETLELPFQFAELYDRSPQRLASGILLYGPPGCGKTLLAGAVASECGLNFISVKGPEVLNKYIGASEQAIRDLFARAASVTPCIVFFDEFDAVAPRRGSDSTGVTDRVVNQLLTFLDGVESRKGVYVMAATSRPDLVDPALLRPGRLDKQLYCGFPDEKERLSILKALASKLNLAEEVRNQVLVEIARDGKELTGADLQALCATAQLLAFHDESSVVTRDHIMRAFSDTRPSVSREDRAKFERIYRQFRGDRQAPSVADNDVMFFSEDAKQKVALM